MSTRVLFTTRLGGVSEGPYAELNLAGHVGDDAAAVSANRDRLAGRLDDAPIVFMRQVHGNDVAVVSTRPDADVDEVDGLVTSSPRTPLGVLVADCVPVLLAGERAVAAVHAGRRGVASGVVGKAVAALRMLDDSPVRAWLGPAICGGCYEVPVDMQAAVAGVVPAARCTTTAGTTGLDLRAGVRAQLLDSGVSDVVVHPACTAEDPRYFSHRRDGVTGRFAGVVIIDG